LFRGFHLPEAQARPVDVIGAEHSPEGVRKLIIRDEVARNLAQAGTGKELGSNLGQNTDYSDWVFSWFFSVPPGKLLTVFQIRARTLLSTSFPVHHSLTILQIDVT
jgi:hypothetical protein